MESSIYFPRMLRFVLCFMLVSVSLTRGFAQDKDVDAEIDAQIAAAMKDPDKPKASKADMAKMEKEAKAQADQADAENKAEEAKQKAKVQALVDAKGPATLPDWMPEVPQFAPSGPGTRKVIDGEAKIVLTGTSPLAPDALADAWDKFKNPKFSHERTGSEINHSADLFVTYRNGEDNSEVKWKRNAKLAPKSRT